MAVVKRAWGHVTHYITLRYFRLRYITFTIQRITSHTHTHIHTLTHAHRHVHTSTGRDFALVEGSCHDLVSTGSIYHAHFAWQVWHGQLSPRFEFNKPKSFSGVEIDQDHVDKRILGGRVCSRTTQEATLLSGQCIHVHIPMHIHIHMHIQIHFHLHLHLHLHTYMHTYIHTYILTYLHTYIHTYMHAYIHTYRQTDRQTDINSTPTLIKQMQIDILTFRYHGHPHKTARRHTDVYIYIYMWYTYIHI